MPSRASTRYSNKIPAARTNLSSRRLPPMAENGIVPHFDTLQMLAMAKLTIAFEEVCVAALSDLLTRYEDSIPPDEQQRLAAQIRRHRVGMIKHRAVLGATGIDV